MWWTNSETKKRDEDTRHLLDACQVIVERSEAVSASVSDLTQRIKVLESDRDRLEETCLDYMDRGERKRQVANGRVNGRGQADDMAEIKNFLKTLTDQQAKTGQDIDLVMGGVTEPDLIP